MAPPGVWETEGGAIEEGGGGGIFYLGKENE